MGLNLDINEWVSRGRVEKVRPRGGVTHGAEWNEVKSWGAMEC